MTFLSICKTLFFLLNITSLPPRKSCHEGQDTTTLISPSLSYFAHGKFTPCLKNLQDPRLIPKQQDSFSFPAPQHLTKPFLYLPWRVDPRDVLQASQGWVRHQSALSMVEGRPFITLQVILLKLLSESWMLEDTIASTIFPLLWVCDAVQQS